MYASKSWSPISNSYAANLLVANHCRPAERIDFEHLAKKTADFSGADLQAVVDRAVEGKLMEAMRSGVAHPLTSKDLLEAASKVRSSTAEWFATARNYVLYANQEGIYDEVRRYLKL